MDRNQIICLFSAPIRSILSRLSIDYSGLYEIRLRVGRPLILILRGDEYFADASGRLCREEGRAYRVTERDIRESMEHIAGYSLYAFEEEVRQGFLTVEGGHRVGIAGKVVLEEGRIKTIRHISCLNLRLSHEIRGCASDVMPHLCSGERVCHTLIISPPRCGKTTLLRDIIRQISDGFRGRRGQTVGVVDERSEIAGSYQGVPQNDVGIRTDVLDCCPKSEGMMMLVRSMSPQVVAVDEIGDYGDIRAIETVIHCGCTLIATVHGDSLEDIRRKPLLRQLTDEQVFERYVLLDARAGAGHVCGIFDGKGAPLGRNPHVRA